MKKISILLADDRREPAEAILLSALPCDPNLGFSKAERLEAARDLLDIQEFRTVAAAENYLSQHPEAPFYLVFADIDFSITASEDPAPNPKQRGLDLIRLLRREFPDTLVKVHTQYPNVRVIQQVLANQGVSVEDIYDVVEDIDLVLLRDDGHLTKDFPRFLRAIGRRIYLNCVQTKNSREVDRALAEAIRNDQFDLPLEALGGFSLKNILAGWCSLHTGEDGMPEIAYLINKADIIPALRNLREERENDFSLAGNLKRRDLKGLENKGFLRLQALRHNQEVYPNLRINIENTTLDIVNEFRANWADFQVENWLDFPNNPIFPRGIMVLAYRLDDDLGAINRDNATADVVFDTLSRILIARRVVLTLSTLEAMGNGIPNCPIIIDLALLAVVRNNPEEAIKHWVYQLQDSAYQKQNHYENRNSTIRQVFNILLGLRKVKGIQCISLDCLLPEELQWIQDIEENFNI